MSNKGLSPKNISSKGLQSRGRVGNTEGVKSSDYKIRFIKNYRSILPDSLTKIKTLDSTTNTFSSGGGFNLEIRTP